ncbi:AAA family ATPase [Metabacillus bambusae]|uniref:AAA family ATPase n=1 Tax=Metabacillus bambusae TaxID=2795218 RepID=A0ABS3NAA2_9BACI|nr:AAA family ATPase [Metabacillus bambusae]MBO1515172.1 AAA family ATPase [Metabacillus bambusae]
MELVYLWVEKYGYFKDTGFHFSNMFEFKYNKETSNLAISDSHTKIMNPVLYSKNISNLSVVVGDNGAGKTSLLRGIIEFLGTYEDYGHLGKFLGAFYDYHNSELKVFSYNMNKLNMTTKECKTVKVSPVSKSEFRQVMKRTKLIYMNNVLDLNDYSYRKVGNVKDASLGGLIRDDFLRNGEMNYIKSDENPLLNYFNNEVYRQLKFLYGYNHKNMGTIIPFKLPDILKVKTLLIGDRLNDVIGDLLINHVKDSKGNSQRNKSIEKAITSVVNMTHQPEWIKQLDPKQVRVFNMVQHLFLNALIEVAKPNTTKDTRLHELDCLIAAYQPYQGGSLLLYISNYLIRLRDSLERISNHANRVAPYQDFLKWLDDNNLFEFEISDIETDTIYIKLNDSNKEYFQEFFAHYNKTCQPFYFLNFSWGLSTGESNMLSLFARLYSVLDVNIRGEGRIYNYFTRKVKCDNVLLLIDEADLSFHPKWQIMYVDVLLKLVSDLFRSCRVQVILTTHSPILLSDVPKSNVIYLKKGINDSANNHQETFGQNIHTLFTDAFFLDKATGHFSNRIIQDVGNDLDVLAKQAQNKDPKSRNKHNLEYYKSIISIIGEPIIRKAFEFKLKEVEMAYQTETLKEAINLYNGLTSEERNLLIQHIISLSEKDTE